MLRQFHIVTAGYNCEKYYHDCYMSLLVQDIDSTISWWVMDDCSIDNTYSLIKALPQTKKVKINLFRTEQNMGSAYSRFFLIRHIIKQCAPQDIVLQLDLDDYLYKHALTAISRVYNQNPSCMCTFGNFVSDYNIRIGNYSSKEINEYAYLRPGMPSKMKPVRTCSASLLKYVKYTHMRMGGEMIRSATDAALFIAIMIRLSSVNIFQLSDKLYYYRKREDSTAKTVSNRKQTFEKIKEYWRQKIEKEKIKKRIWNNGVKIY